jgi:pyruvate dehydrogenase E2 component (dihydrolipoamide acetyltransferase)
MSQIEFYLPDVGEGLSEGEIVRWLVTPGDEVVRDQTVVEIETDKSIVELPAPADGTILELGGAEGDVLPVGHLLMVMRAADENAAPPSPTSAIAEDSPAPRAEVPSASPSTPVAPERTPAAVGPSGDTSPSRRVKASPAVRRLALEAGVDLVEVQGSGAGGRVTRADVEREIDGGGRQEAAPAASAAGPTTVGGAPSEDVVERLRGLRRQIAKTMTQAWQQVPHITDIRQVDATALVAARRRLAEDMRDTVGRFTYLPLLIRAVTETLATSPKFNATIDVDAETITYFGRRNIGLAAATPDGLIVPVLHDADQLGLAEIARRVDELAEGARARSLSPDQLRGGTCTITNFGSFGGWIATPIIRPPEAAIVGFGRIHDAVVAVDGEPVVRPTLPISVSADHRLIDGDDMGAFLNRLTQLLEEPVLLLGGAR